MGFFQTIAQTVHVFKADTTNIEAGLKRLQGQEKAAAKATVESVKQRNNAFDQWSRRLADMNNVVELGTKAIQFGKAAWEEYEKAALKAGGAQAAKAKEMRSSIDALNQSWRESKIIIGEIVAGMAPMLRGLSEMVTYINEAAAGLQDMGLGGDFGTLWKYGRGGFGQVPTETIGGLGMARGSRMAMDAAGVEIGRRRQKQIAELNKQLLGIRPEQGGGGYDISASEIAGFSAAGRTSQEWLDARFGQRAADYQFRQSLAGVGTQPAGADMSWRSPLTGDELRGLEAKAAGYGDQLRREHKESVLTGIFGPLDEFDAYTEKMEMLGQAVGIMSGAVQGGFDAWITGSKNAANAFKAAMGQIIMGLASNMIANALSEGALAVGALARGIGGNPLAFAEAAAHGKAAAGYAVAGAAIGGIARATGAANWGGGGGAGGGGGGYSAGGGGGYGGGGARPGTTNHIYVGDLIRSDRYQRQEINRQVRRARKEAGEDIVEDR